MLSFEINLKIVEACPRSLSTQRLSAALFCVLKLAVSSCVASLLQFHSSFDKSLMANQSSSCPAVAFTSAALSCASQLLCVLHLYRASSDGNTPLALNAMLMLINVVCCAPAQRPENSQVSICQLSLAATEPDLRQRLTCGCCLTSVPSPKSMFYSEALPPDQSSCLHF